MTEQHQRKVILLTDIIDQKVRKEKELEFYQAELIELTRKISYLQKEVNLTNLIIDLIQGERILDMQEHIDARAIEQLDEEK